MRNRASGRIQRYRTLHSNKDLIMLPSIRASGKELQEFEFRMRCEVLWFTRLREGERGADRGGRLQSSDEG